MAYFKRAEFWHRTRFKPSLDALVSNNTNELKTRALGHFELEVSTLGSPAEVGL